MMMLGVDTPKRTHTTVAADQVGREHAQRALPATDVGHQRLLEWARESYPGPSSERLWAIEDCLAAAARPGARIDCDDCENPRIPQRDGAGCLVELYGYRW